MKKKNVPKTGCDETLLYVTCIKITIIINILCDELNPRNYLSNMNSHNRNLILFLAFVRIQFEQDLNKWLLFKCYYTLFTFHIYIYILDLCIIGEIENAILAQKQFM